MEPDSEHLPDAITNSSEHLRAASEHLEPNSEHSDTSSEYLQTPEDIARPVREVGKVSKTLMSNTILRLCQDRFMPLKQMAQLLGRSSDTIRVHYLYETVRDGRLEPKYPDKTNHPGQAYKATSRD